MIPPGARLSLVSDVPLPPVTTQITAQWAGPTQALAIDKSLADWLITFIVTAKTAQGGKGFVY